MALAMFTVGFAGNWALKRPRRGNEPDGVGGIHARLLARTHGHSTLHPYGQRRLRVGHEAVSSTRRPTPSSGGCAEGWPSATIIGCGGFAAAVGLLGGGRPDDGARVALGKMERYRYDPRLSTGVVAAGGTLGILIPPSTGFCDLRHPDRASIGRLFLAGVLPGLLLVAPFRHRGKPPLSVETPTSARGGRRRTPMRSCVR